MITIKDKDQEKKKKTKRSVTGKRQLETRKAQECKVQEAKHDLKPSNEEVPKNSKQSKQKVSFSHSGSWNI